METYETWAAIRILTDNPELRFERVGVPPSLGVILSVDKDGYLSAEFNDENSINGNIKLSGEWKLVQTQVTFIEAVKSDKNFRYRTWVDDFYNAAGVIHRLGKDYKMKEIEMMLNKKAWIMKEEI